MRAGGESVKKGGPRVEVEPPSARELDTIVAQYDPIGIGPVSSFIGPEQAGQIGRAARQIARDSRQQLGMPIRHTLLFLIGEESARNYFVAGMLNVNCPPELRGQVQIEGGSLGYLDSASSGFEGGKFHFRFTFKEGRYKGGEFVERNEAKLIGEVSEDHRSVGWRIRNTDHRVTAAVSYGRYSQIIANIFAEHVRHSLIEEDGGLTPARGTSGSTGRRGARHYLGRESSARRHGAIARLGAGRVFGRRPGVASLGRARITRMAVR